MKKKRRSVKGRKRMTPAERRRFDAVRKKARREGWAQWIRSEADEWAVLEGCYYDSVAAEHIITFFSDYLVHTKGEWAGKPFIPLGWQANNILRPLFGWKKANGKRRYRVVYIEVPKKNGKTTLAAGILLYMLVADGEVGAECYSAAYDRKQAAEAFDEAAEMVRWSKNLRAYIVVRDSRKQMALHQFGATYAALSRDAAGGDAINAHCTVFDELHNQKTRDLWDRLEFAGCGRTQPLLIVTTTAGTDRQSICYEQHQRAQAILAGTVIDSEFFAYIRAADDNDDWTKLETAKKANPGYGVNIDPDELASAIRKAKGNPSKENNYRRFRLCQWVAQAERWFSLNQWDRCGRRFKLGRLEELACCGALDLSSTRDLTAFVLAWRMQEDPERYAIWPWVWCPEARLEKENNPHHWSMYRYWVKQGFMRATPGDAVAYNMVFDDLVKLGERFDITAVGYDPWNSTHLVENLKEEEGWNMLKVPQGYAHMSAPSKLFEKMLYDRTFTHGGNPILRMEAEVVTLRRYRNHILPDRENEHDKIDALVAAIMALGMAVRLPKDDGRVTGIISSKRIPSR